MLISSEPDVDQAIFDQRIVPVFVTPSTSTTYRAIVIATQLSFAALEVVSNVLSVVCRS